MRNSSDVFDSASDMKPTQNMTSLFRVPRQNVAPLLRPVILLFMLPIWLVSGGAEPVALLVLAPFLEIKVSRKMDVDEVADFCQLFIESNSLE